MAVQPVQTQINRAESISPHDTNINRCDAIWVGTGGDVVAIFSNDAAAVTIKNIPSGSWLPGPFTKILSTNTTAADIVGVHWL